MQFKDIQGQTVIANQLTAAADAGRVPHAQMFVGKTVSGSLALALAYAQYLNCTDRQHYHDGVTEGAPMPTTALRADSCGHCASCKKYQQLTHPDLHLYFPTNTNDKIKKDAWSGLMHEDFVDFLGKYNQTGTLDQWYDFLGIENKQAKLGVLDANDMVRILGLKAYEGGYKVVVVWLAEKMNLTMANTILKNLEEPSPNTVIILVTEDNTEILPTIISRTQPVNIPLVQTATQRWVGDISIEDEKLQDFNGLYVAWMRQLFKLNMVSLSAWVDGMSTRIREQQKAFLLYAQEATRQCFLKNNAGMGMQIDFGDPKFNTSFPTMITQRNIEGLCKAFDDATFAIERNAHPKITFMQLSFNISKQLKKR